MTQSHAQPSATRSLFKLQSAFGLFAALIILALHASSAQADLFDSETVLNNTGAAQSQMNLIFAGNVTTDIDGSVNPFGSGGTESITYNSGPNTTTVAFSAGAAIAAGASATYALSFNVNFYDSEAGFWDAESDPFPTLSVSATTMTGPVYYGLFYTQLAFAADSSDTAIMYEEVPMPGDCGTFEMTNNNEEPVINDAANDTVSTFDSAVGGAWITWPIPLDDLNPTDTPDDAPLFWSVGAPPTLAEGDSFSETICPTPSSLAGGGLLAGILIVTMALSRKAQRRPDHF
jgi:hypothetical protein